MPQQPTHHKQTTRIIPGLCSAYQIVSLPYWAWYWLEDFMRENRINYQGIYDTFGQENISQTLQNIAQLHQEQMMREMYNLANDNDLEEQNNIENINQKHLAVCKKELKLPKIYKLFGFMPCATTLEAVWERRHYEDSNRVK